ncbi:hydroxymyristoyl-ACP dehydratase [Streptacidiphilus sp. 4-A2]|nr:hydroxymyristoyl-ACP dehydratase [Streptacidiphilus sp. 4-A2]
MTTAATAPPSTGVPQPSPLPRLAGFERVLEFEPGLRAVALRNIPGTLPFFATHFPRRPVLPGVLLLESMAALAGAAAGGAHWRLHTAGTLRFRHFVGPGDQLVLTVELLSRSLESTEWRASATVGGRTVATARTLTLLPLGGTS